MAYSKADRLGQRRLRVRRKISGAPERPRLSIHKTLKHLYAQVIDDTAGKTICFATTNTKPNKLQGKSFCNIAWAKKLGAEVAAKAASKGVSTVVFDRGGYRYHGVVKAFGDSAREAGLKF
jgi:large subunit ribosomal protein L18